MPQTGWIVVADMMNNRVVLLTVDGDFIGQFGSSGVGLGNMQHPADVAVAESYIVVSEWSGQRLQLFTLMGAAVRIIEVPGEKECYGVCFDAQRRRILAVDRTIVGWSEYSLSGEVLRRVCANSADCPLRRPCGVGVNSLGQILLSDAERNSIHKFRQDGSWAGLLIQGHTSEFESDTAAQGGPVVMRTPPVIDGLDVKMSEPMDSHAARAKELEVFPEERFLRVGRIFAFPCLFDVTESNVFVSCILSSSIEWVVDTDVSYSRRRELIKAFAWLHSRLRYARRGIQLPSWVMCDRSQAKGPAPTSLGGPGEDRMASHGSEPRHPSTGRTSGAGGPTAPPPEQPPLGGGHASKAGAAAEAPAAPGSRGPALDFGHMAALQASASASTTADVSNPTPPAPSDRYYSQAGSLPWAPTAGTSAAFATAASGQRGRAVPTETGPHRGAGGGGHWQPPQAVPATTTAHAGHIPGKPPQTATTQPTGLVADGGGAEAPIRRPGAAEHHHDSHRQHDQTSNTLDPSAHGHAPWHHAYGPVPGMQPSQLRPVASGAMAYQAAPYAYPPEAAGPGASVVYGMPHYAPPYASPPQYLPPPGYYPAGVGYGYGPAWGAVPPWAARAEPAGAHAAAGHPVMAPPRSSTVAGDARGETVAGVGAMHGHMAGDSQFPASPGTSHVARAMLEQGVRLVPPPAGWAGQRGAAAPASGEPRPGAGAQQPPHRMGPAGHEHGDSHA